jgi:anti-anti-sigma factor
VRLADVQFRSHGYVVIAHITGEVDLSNAGELRTAMFDALANDTSALVLELGDVDHLDSAGIRLLYSLRADLRARGQALRLVIPPRSAAHDALRLAGVAHHIELAETVDEVIAELAS